MPLRGKGAKAKQAARDAKAYAKVKRNALAWAHERMAEAHTREAQGLGTMEESQAAGVAYTQAYIVMWECDR